jgi:tRNA threonylcarbamoyladenosine biosynthesis protein TsaB
MKLLAIETSTEACSVAVWSDGEILERFEIAPRRHTELVLPWAGELLAEAGLAKSQLDAIAVGRGPGAFTGVRLAVALVQGMALALDKPVLSISTLAALALSANIDATANQQVNDDDRILAAIDARMGELYLGLFRRDAENLVVSLADEWMAAPSSPNVKAGGPLVGVGSGFNADGRSLVTALGGTLRSHDAQALPRAANVCRLAALAFDRGEAIAADLLEPAYLRNKVALTLSEQAQSRSERA